MLVCNVCGSRNIRQEASIMLNPNNPKLSRVELLPYEEFHWHDYYWCRECDDESLPIEDPHEKAAKEEK